MSFSSNFPGGGGSKLNGLIDEYRVATGENVSAGDFVRFVNGYTAVIKNEPESVQLVDSVEIDSGGNSKISSVLLSDGRVFVAHSYYSSRYLYATIVTVDGDVIVPGIDVPLSTTKSSVSHMVNAILLPNGNVFIAHASDSSNYYLYGMVVTVDGDNIIIGADTALQTSRVNTGYRISAVLLLDGRIFIAHSGDSFSSLTLYGIVVTVNNMVITTGTDVVINSSAQYTGSVISASLLQDGRIFIAFSYGTNYYLYGIIVTIDGSTIVKGTSKLLRGAFAQNGRYISTVSLSNNRVLVAHSGDYPKYNLYATIITIDGDTMTASPDVLLSVIDVGASYTVNLIVLSDGRLFVAHTDNSTNYYLYGIILTVNDTVISLDSSFALNNVVNSSGRQVSLVLLPDGKVFLVHCYGDDFRIYGMLPLSMELEKDYRISAITSTDQMIVGVTKTKGASGDVIKVYEPLEEHMDPRFNVNGFIDTYKVAAGEDIGAGDFVRFTGQERKILDSIKIQSNGYGFDPTVIPLSDGSVFVCYIEGSSVYGRVISIDDEDRITVNAETILDSSPEYANKANAVLLSNGIILVSYHVSYEYYSDTVLIGITAKVVGTTVKKLVRSELATNIASGSGAWSTEIGNNKALIVYPVDWRTSRAVLLEVTENVITILKDEIIPGVEFSSYNVRFVSLNDTDVFMVFPMTISGKANVLCSVIISRNDDNLAFGSIAQLSQASSSGRAFSPAKLENGDIFVAHSVDSGSIYYQLYGVVVSIAGESIHQNEDVPLSLNAYSGYNIKAVAMPKNVVSIFHSSGPTPYPLSNMIVKIDPPAISIKTDIIVSNEQNSGYIYDAASMSNYDAFVFHRGADSRLYGLVIPSPFTPISLVSSVEQDIIGITKSDPDNGLVDVYEPMEETMAPRMKVNGTTKTYKIATGKTANPGDFVRFVSELKESPTNYLIGQIPGIDTERKNPVLLPSGKIFLSYPRGGSGTNVGVYGEIITINDNNTFSIGTPVAIVPPNYVQTIRSISLRNGKVLVIYSAEWSTPYLYGVIVSTNGEVTTSGTPTQIVSTKSSFDFHKNASLLLLKDGRVLITYSDNSTSNDYLTCVIVSISGTTITVSATKQLSSTTKNAVESASLLLKDGTVLVLHSGGDYLYGMIVTISGTAITPGTDTRLSTTSYSQISVIPFLMGDGKVLVVHGNTSSRYLYAMGLSISGSTISTVRDVQLSTIVDSAYNDPSAVMMADNVYIEHYGSGGSLYGMSIVYSSGEVSLISDRPLAPGSHSGKKSDILLLSDDRPFVLNTNGTDDLRGMYFLEEETRIAPITAKNQTVVGLVKTGEVENKVDIFEPLSESIKDEGKLAIDGIIKTYATMAGANISPGSFVTYVNDQISSSTTAQIINNVNSYFGYVIEAVLLSNGDVFIAHRNGTTVAGTLYGVVISFYDGSIVVGPATVLSSVAYTGMNINVVALDNNRVFIAHSYDSNYRLYGIVVKVSGLDITIGSDTALSTVSYDGTYSSSILLPDGRVFVCHTWTSGYYLGGILLKIDDLNINKGTDTLLSNISSYIGIVTSLTLISDNKVFIAHSGTSNYPLYGMILTITGDSMSVKVDTVLSSTNQHALTIGSVLLRDGDILILHGNGSSATRTLNGIVVSINNDVITVGTDTVITPDAYTGVSYDMIQFPNGNVFLSYAYGSTYVLRGKIIAVKNRGIVSGAEISINASANTGRYLSSVLLPNGSPIIVHSMSSNYYLYGTIPMASGVTLANSFSNVLGIAKSKNGNKVDVYIPK